MAYTVKLLHQAEIELKKACEWYEDKLPGLGAEFIAAVDQKLNLVAKNPLHYNVLFSRKYRFAHTSDYTYVVVFRVIKSVKRHTLFRYLIQVVTRQNFNFRNR